MKNLNRFFLIVSLGALCLVTQVAAMRGYLTEAEAEALENSMYAEARINRAEEQRINAAREQKEAWRRQYSIQDELAKVIDTSDPLNTARKMKEIWTHYGMSESMVAMEALEKYYQAPRGKNSVFILVAALKGPNSWVEDLWLKNKIAQDPILKNNLINYLKDVEEKQNLSYPNKEAYEAVAQELVTSGVLPPQ